jgi:hypothetical protein
VVGNSLVELRELMGIYEERKRKRKRGMKDKRKRKRKRACVKMQMDQFCNTTFTEITHSRCI